MRKERITEHFEQVAKDYDYWKKKNWYYYQSLKEIAHEIIPFNSNVLELGCGTGEILASLNPKNGLGVDISKNMVAIAKKKYPNIRFKVDDAADPKINEKFDYVIMPDLIEHLHDVNAAIKNLKKVMDKDSTLIITVASDLWEPILHLAEKLRLKMPEGDHKWLPVKELKSILERNGFVVKKIYSRTLIPIYIPLVSDLMNKIAPKIGLSYFCLTRIIIAKLE